MSNKKPTPFELYIIEVEKLHKKAGGDKGAFNLVGKTTTALLNLAKQFQKLENNIPIYDTRENCRDLSRD